MVLNQGPVIVNVGAVSMNVDLALVNPAGPPSGQAEPLNPVPPTSMPPPYVVPDPSKLFDA